MTSIYYSALFPRLFYVCYTLAAFLYRGLAFRQSSCRPICICPFVKSVRRSRLPVPLNLELATMFRFRLPRLVRQICLLFFAC